LLNNCLLAGEAGNEYVDFRRGKAGKGRRCFSMTVGGKRLGAVLFKSKVRSTMWRCDRVGDALRRDYWKGFLRRKGAFVRKWGEQASGVFRRKGSISRDDKGVARRGKRFFLIKGKKGPVSHSKDRGGPREKWVVPAGRCNLEGRYVRDRMILPE